MFFIYPAERGLVNQIIADQGPACISDNRLNKRMLGLRRSALRLLFLRV
jgi:hypothetical protein